MSRSRVISVRSCASAPLARRGLWLLASLVTLSCLACSALIDTDKRKLGAAPIACEPGQAAACSCPDGSVGVQRCSELMSYGPCACATATDRAAAGGGGQAGRAGSAGVAGRAGTAG